jgi:hypothetical protein
LGGAAATVYYFLAEAGCLNVPCFGWLKVMIPSYLCVVSLSEIRNLSLIANYSRCQLIPSV